MYGISPVIIDRKVKAQDAANAEIKAFSSDPLLAILKPAIEMSIVNVHVIILTS